MAEFFTSFPSQQIKPVEFRAQDLINIGRTGIAYQREEQGNKERLALQDFFSNPENFQTDGRIDLEKINARVPQLAPLTGRDVIRNMSDLSTAQTQAISAKQNLTQSQRGMVGQAFNILGKAGVNDRNSYFAALDHLVESNPGNKDLARLADSYKTIWGKMPENTNWSQLAIAGAQTLLPVSEQETKYAPQPGSISSGAATFGTVTQPSVGGLPPTQAVGGAPLVVNQPPLSSQMQPTGRLDLNGNPTAYVQDPQTGQIREVTIPAGAFANQMPGAQPAVPVPGGMPGPNVVPGAPTVPGGVTYPPRMPTSQSFPVPSPGPNVSVGTGQPVAPNAPVRMEGQSPFSLETADKLRVNTMTQAAQVPQRQFNNNQIIKLADAAITGRGAETLAALAGGFAAVPWTGDTATYLNELGHYLKLETATLAQSAGLNGSDQARALGEATVGSTGWTAPAIKNVARLNRALSTSTALLNEGIQNAVSRPGATRFAPLEFQQRWTQTLGPNGIDAIRLYDATQHNDTEAIQNIVKELGGVDSDKYKSVRSKLQDLQRLIGGR
jgi:hypothetical protein